MSDSPAEITRAAFEEVILAKVIENPAFAARLKADPKAALREAFDVEFPADLQISVFQETPNYLMLCIPLMMTDEIADSELEAVAGGIGMGPRDGYNRFGVWVRGPFWTDPRYARPQSPQSELERRFFPNGRRFYG
jgi:hypothetical protein